MQDLQRACHPDCAVCSEKNWHGLQLAFHFDEESGELSAAFEYDKSFEGYAGMVHGGVISAIMDGAMTNCLFAHDKTAVTAEFHVRYRHPVLTDRPGKVKAWISRFTPPIFVVESQISQDGEVKATATGKFMERPKLRSKCVDGKE